MLALVALVLTIAGISLRAYYVAIALVCGTLLMGHRELWYLIRGKKTPPIDERIQGNLTRSVRNGFVFFAIATAFLMLFFSINRTAPSETVHVLGGLLVSGGFAYLVSYFYYDRVEPKLTERRLKMLHVFLLIAGISIATFIVSVFLHNAVSALFHREEPVFFFIAVVLSPLAFAVGIGGALVLFLQGLFSRAL